MTQPGNGGGKYLRRDIDPSGAVEALNGLAPGQAGGFDVVVVQGDHGVEGGSVHVAMLRRDCLATGKRRPGPARRGFRRPPALFSLTHPACSQYATIMQQFVTHHNNLP